MNIIDYPEKFCIHISGTFNRGEQPPFIFQRSNGTLQKKLGPIIPTNPRTRLQQLNRILFRAALDNADSLSETQKDIYRKRIPQHQHGMSWRVKAIQDFMKPNRFSHIRFNESMLFGGLPLRDAFRLNEITFDDAFLTTNESLPLNKAAIEAKYPNIDISSIFPEEP